MIAAVISAVPALVAAIIFVWLETRWLRRDYAKKIRVASDLAEALTTDGARLHAALKSIDATQRDLEMKLETINRAVKVIQPFADQIEKTY